MRLLILAVLVTCIFASPQYTKSRYSGVKGGHGFQTDNLVRPNNTQHGNYNFSIGTTPANYEKGVCYIEVPTANLVRDPAHVPAGNGSRPDLSRIRTCCQGYTKNIHNYKICDPVCTKECLNALCTEPETCTCYPDHVVNLAGFCVPTCPIGCHHGRCEGGECICKNGYRLDASRKFCIPNCRDNCNGLGICISPNTCDCESGYRPTPEGSCKPHCENCGEFADCIAPHDCRCRLGYERNPKGDCIPVCNNNCQPNGKCVAPNVCNYITTTTASSISERQPGQNNNPLNMETTKSPDYQRPKQPVYPGNQLPYNSNNQPTYYPGNQPPYYPGYQQRENPNSNQDQIHHSENQQPFYPGYQPSYFPGGQPKLNPNQQNNGNLSPNYPGQNPLKPNPQPIYYNPVQQPLNYPGNQGPFGHRPEYVNNHHPQSPPNHNNEPYIPGSQYYPTNQPSHYYPQYPQQHQYPQGIDVSLNQSYPSFTSNQETQNVHSDSQLGNVETLCSKPCINGACVAHDKCVCNEGYVLDDTDISVFRCKPYCPGGCPNGVCSSPYFCICNQGYYKDHSVKGRSNCVKRGRRSVDASVNIADLLIFEIPDDEELYGL